MFSLATAHHKKVCILPSDSFTHNFQPLHILNYGIVIFVHLTLVSFKLVGLGSGCGCSVGRAVASDTRGPRFEFSHRQDKKIIMNIFPVNCSNDENEEKEAGYVPIEKVSRAS